MSMNQDRQAIIARDMLDMIVAYSNDSKIKSYFRDLTYSLSGDLTNPIEAWEYLYGLAEGDIDPEYVNECKQVIQKDLPACPKCGSKNIAEITGGEPALDDERVRQGFEAGRLVAGSCDPSDNFPYHCNDCEHEWSPEWDEQTRAIEAIITNQEASAKLLQSELKIGYVRAARIIDYLEQAGVVSQPNADNHRTLHIETVEQAQDLLKNQYIFAVKPDHML